MSALKTINVSKEAFDLFKTMRARRVVVENAETGNTRYMRPEAAEAQGLEYRAVSEEEGMDIIADMARARMDAVDAYAVKQAAERASQTPKAKKAKAPAAPKSASKPKAPKTPKPKTSSKPKTESKPKSAPKSKPKAPKAPKSAKPSKPRALKAAPEAAADAGFAAAQALAAAE